MLELNRLAKKIHQNNKLKGFYETEKNLGEMLMLIVTEVAEACEADRKNDAMDPSIDLPGLVLQAKKSPKMFKENFENKVKDTFEDELADIMMRTLDMAAYLDIDIAHHILAKIEYNKTREHMHDGKKY
mgnify:CR=1 FL=1